jgi:predicted nucleic acid-binding Zn ribbon protein
MRGVYGVIDEGGKKVRRIIILEDRVCVICGKVFTPLTQRSVVCSKNCGKRNDYLKHKEKRIRQVELWRESNIEHVREQRKKKYWSDPEKYRKQTKKYCDAHREEVRESNISYKDKVRHGDLRDVLIGIYGLVCQQCGVSGESFGIVAHHISGDPTDHKNQTLLCRSCHAKIHDLGSKRKKFVSKEQIEEALSKFKLLEDACKHLGITRSFLRKKRIEYGFPNRKVPNGMGERQRKR